MTGPPAPQPDREPRGGGHRRGRPGRRPQPRPGSGPGRGPSAARRPPADDPARLVALDVLRAVEERDAYANLLLPRLLRERRLDARDAAFATELTYGALRAEGRLDAVLAACSDRPLARLDPPVRAALRLGAQQVLGMRTPPHAAVAATVDLVRAAGAGRAAGFVNAVLRRVAERDLDGWLDHLGAGPGDDRLAALALQHAHPRWVAAAFRDALDDRSPDLAETAAALAADDARPEVHLVARPGRTTREALLAEAGAGAVPGPWSPHAVRLEGGGAPGDLPLVRSGAAGVQDEGSQLVARALADVPVDGRDAVWLDVCAGPGGKAALLQGLLAARAGTAGRLVAADVTPSRAGLVAEALRGGPVTAVAVVADGRRPAVAPGSVDRVLLDAPCTGLGALRRRPEARWRRQPEDADRLATLQRELLAGALDAVRPGGVVAYVVCSPHLRETRDVVAAVLAERDDVEQLDARPHLPGVPHLGQGPAVQLWPHQHGTDAMHLALLRRTGDTGPGT